MGLGLHVQAAHCETGDAEHWIALCAHVQGRLEARLRCLLTRSHGARLARTRHGVRSHLRARAARRFGTGPSRAHRPGQLEGFTGVAVGSLLGVVVCAARRGRPRVLHGQSVALFRFGVAWAEGVAANKHNELSIGAMLYDHVNAVLYLSITIGLALASIIGRWLLAVFRARRSPSS